MAAVRTETLPCRGCLNEWQRPVGRGRKPHYCPACAALPPPPRLIPTQRERAAGLALASRLTTYRLGIEIAASAIRLGKYDEALAALDAAINPRVIRVP